MNYYKLYIVLGIIIILILIKCYKLYSFKNIENFEDRLFIPNDNYDKQYVDMYNLVWNNNDNINDDIKNINEYALKKYSTNKNKKINLLEIGCKNGLYSKKLKNLNYNIISEDKSKNMLKNSISLLIIKFIF